MSHIMIVVSPYYKEVSDFLLLGTKACLKKNHATYEIFEVAGALEIPLAAKFGAMREASKGVENPKFDGCVALGCVIRGETSHYDVVCQESARGLSNIAMEFNFPVGNGILTCDTMEQAIVRADPDQKNKGADAVMAVLSLLKIKHTLKV